ncbi:MAG TPA: divalent metal cation transporter [Steroidobacteraceae bacterium]|nr:divalent metal cation transporter [Steroidobacteraceae bacterium]
MGNLGEIFLGILTAMGGFVEIGELTFTLNAGQHFGYTLLWMVPLGTLGIMVYCEMAGRIAAVRKRAVFSLVRERTGFTPALITLVASLAVNLLTCAGEIGGVALLLKIATGSPYRLVILLALAILLLVVWLVSFKWIERIYGLGGLLLVVFIVAFVALGPDWGEVASGLVPRLPAGASQRDTLLYFFYAVALLSSIMLPYETYFYASGGIEDEWQPKDVTLNRVVVLIGFALGGLLAASLVGVGSAFFASRQIEPQLPGAAALGAGHVFGMWGVVIALLGMFFAFGGAAIETALASAYNLAQFAGWPWGKHRPKRETGRFTLSWIAIFALASLVALSGVNPVTIVEYSIVFSVVILPLTYFPVLMIARDKRIMGAHVNGIIADALGWGYLVLITVAAIAALPLFVLTHGGRG